MLVCFVCGCVLVCLCVCVLWLTVMLGGVCLCVRMCAYCFLKMCVLFADYCVMLYGMIFCFVIVHG